MFKYIIFYLIKLYAVVIVSVIVHEIFHYLSSLILRKPVSDIYIGANFFSIKIWKLHLSPFVFYGYVEIEDELLDKMIMPELVFFYLSGALGNIVLSVLANFINSCYFSRWFFIINIYYAIASLLPFFIGNNDITALIKLIKKRKVK